MATLKARLEKLGGGAPLYPLAVLFGLNSVDELDRTAFNVLLPDIRDSFGLSLAGVLLLVSLITPMVVVAGVAIAYYADRAPRVRLAILGATLWSVFSFATGLVVNIGQMALARLGSGLAKATNDPTHNSLLADYYPVDVRPTVYAVHRAANNVGNFFGPILAGTIALWFGWRMPFLLLAIPTVLCVIAAFKLRDPARGVQDRLALGASAEDAAVEETPPRFAEATKMLYAVKSLRRIYIALPFVGASVFGMASLLSLYYADVFNLNSAERGFVQAAGEAFGVVGIAVGAPITQRLLNRDPARVLRFLGLTAVLVGGCLVVLSIAPNVGVAIGAAIVLSAATATFIPGLYAVLSLAIPAKARSLGFVYGSLWLLPGVLLLPILGGVGDTYGLRTAVFLLAPLYVIGFFIIASAGKFLPSDIDMVRKASMAEQEIRRALAQGEPKLLMVRDLDLSYDSVQVLFEVDFDLYPGETVALLGTNGAGKSTLLKAISGLADPSGGTIYFDGEDITHADPGITFRAGVIQMPGGRSVFPTLTVDEHIRLAQWMLDDAAAAQAATAEVLELFPRLGERWDQHAGNLSGGEQQMLGLAMALIGKPKLLMIDELSLGLAPNIVEQLLNVVRRVREQGTAVILVEQSVNVALTVADRAYFMEKGEVRFSGPTAELLERGDILRAVFLQGAASYSVEVAPTDIQPVLVRESRGDIEDSGRGSGPILEVEGLSKHFQGIRAVNDVTFALGRNEVLGLIGPNGAGKTTIFDLISGMLVADGGRITFDGVDATSQSADTRARRGLGRSFQDARIFGSLTVAENIAIGLNRHLEVRDPVAAALRLPAVFDEEEDVAWTVNDLIELMNLGAYRDKFASELSTGSRRVVDLTMAIAHDPKVLLLDEPSSGIAQREAEALGPLLKRIQRETECSLLVIEHDMPLITGVSDRMIALELGAVIAEGTPSEVTTDPRVVSSYLGGDVASINRSGVVETRSSNGHRRRTPLRAGRGS